MGPLPTFCIYTGLLRHQPVAFKILFNWILKTIGLRQSDQLINVSDVLAKETVEHVSCCFRWRNHSRTTTSSRCLRRLNKFLQVPLIVRNLSSSIHPTLRARTIQYQA